MAHVTVKPVPRGVICLISSRNWAACSKSSSLMALSSFFCSDLSRSACSRDSRKRFRHLCRVPRAFVHRFEANLPGPRQRFYNTPDNRAVRFFEVRLRETTARTSGFPHRRKIVPSPATPKAEHQIRERGNRPDHFTPLALAQSSHKSSFCILVPYDLGQMHCRRLFFAIGAQHNTIVYRLTGDFRQGVGNSSSSRRVTRPGLPVADDPPVNFHHRHDFRACARQKTFVRVEQIVTRQVGSDTFKPDSSASSIHRPPCDAVERARRKRRREQRAVLHNEQIVARAFGTNPSAFNITASSQPPLFASILARMLLR